MATALDLIKQSLSLIHVLDSGEEPSASEAQDSFDALNDMLDLWSVPGLYVYSTKSEALTWPANTESRTIGATGDFVTTRPTKVEESSYVTTAASEDYPIIVLPNRQSYSWILNKDISTTYPEYIYYEPTYPDGTLYIWPVPVAAVTLYLHTPQQLSQLTAISDTIAYPPGYKDAIKYALAVRLSSIFGVAAPPEVVSIASSTSRTIKRVNKKSPLAELEVANIGTGDRYNIYTDSR